jgi:ribosomal protein L11 methyltransferase
VTETYEGWIAAEITVPEEIGPDDDRLDVLSSELFDLGAGGIETRDEERPIRLIASFPPSAAGEELMASVSGAVEGAGIQGARVTLERYQGIDWAEHWKRHFTIISFSGSRDRARLWVVPTWLEPPSEAKHVLRIDPSSAFGTGLHATTAMCIEKLIALSPIERVLDIGTGTGILALAALELGAKRAVGTDNDPEALRVARENAVLNGFGDRLTLSSSDPAELGERFDVVVANILARPLIDLADQITLATSPGGRVILSGITVSQMDDVIRAYEDRGFSVESTKTREEWARLDLLRPAVHS